MPLGGSVTRGVGSSSGNGYRKPLLEMLHTNGIKAEMVGSRRDGTTSNNDHEGWRGFRIDEVEQKARISVRKLLPDVFAVNAGSNDCLQCFQIDRAGRRMGELLDCLWFASPRSTVLLSTLVVSADRDVDSLIVQVNDQFRAVAARKAYEQKRIVLIDMHTPEGPDVRGLVDGIHPDDEGYNKMAKLWFRGMQEALAKGFIC